MMSDAFELWFQCKGDLSVPVLPGRDRPRERAA